MAGTKTGGSKAAQTIKEKYGEDYYTKIGAMGGKTKTTKKKGFAANPELARRAGQLGGKNSSRAKLTSHKTGDMEYELHGQELPEYQSRKGKTLWGTLTALRRK